MNGLPVEPPPRFALIWPARNASQMPIAVFRDDDAAKLHNPPLPAEHRWVWPGVAGEPETWAQAVERMGREDLPLPEAVRMVDLDGGPMVRREAVARHALDLAVDDYVRAATDLAAASSDGLEAVGRGVLRGQMGQAQRDADRVADALGLARPDWVGLRGQALGEEARGDG